MKQVKKCSKCGKTKPLDAFGKDAQHKDGLRSACKLCRAVSKKRYDQEHKEEIVAYSKKYRQEHKEQIVAWRAKHYRENKEELAARTNRYYREHKEKIAAQKKACYQTPEGKRARIAAQEKYEQKPVSKARYMRFRQSPKGKAASIRGTQKRRARKKGVLYELFDPQEVFERDGWRCQHCHKKVQWLNKSPHSPLYPNLDHIVPLSKGGEHTRRNTQLLCRACNSKKGTNDIGEQLRLLG